MTAPPEPALRVLSLGAGVQSTTLALLAVEGVLPRLDGAIFADTGWEPKAVYETLDRAETRLADAGIPLYRVSRGGTIRGDVLDPRVFATIPAFTLVTKSAKKPIRWTFCTCEWAHLYLSGDGDRVPALAAYHGMARFELESVRDSLTRAIEATSADSELLMDDDEIEDKLDGIAQALAQMNALGWARVPHKHDGCDFGRVVTEWHHYTVDEPGRVKRQCTGKYKIEPIQRKVRELLGAPVTEVECRFCQGTGQRVAPWNIEAGTGQCSVCRGRGTRRLVGSPPKGAMAEQWIGFSTDEIQRVKTAGYPSSITPRFPLIELGMSRSDCEQFLKRRGWTVAKSACIGCPFASNRQWRDMRDNRPDEWADAVGFDREFRSAPGLNGQRFLHPSMKPLDQAPIDQLNSKERERSQMSLFDLLAEEGDPDGCSPYGCRSGHEAGAA